MADAVFFTKNKLQILSKLPNIMFTFFYRELLIHPHLAVEKIRAGVQIALQGDVSKNRLPLPQQFTVDITYKEHAMATKASFFPGAVSTQAHSIRFESNDYFEVLRLFAFVL